MSVTGDGDGLMLAVHELLQHGPMPMHEVIDRLTDAGDLDDLYDEHGDDDELTEVVLDHIVVDDAPWLSGDHTLALSAQLTEGLVLTHRVTADEIEQGGVWVTPDLGILD